jgi:copper homeostasis protein
VTSHRVVVEIAVQDLSGVRVASRVGAARAELCVALGSTGGLTPSRGLIELAMAAAHDEMARAGGKGADAAVGGEHRAGAFLPRTRALHVHPLIRPRPGGFVFDADEVAVQVRDIRGAAASGVSGVVVGALTASGEVDRRAMEAFMSAADGIEVTFHRAIDAVRDPKRVVDHLCELGVTRVLTSGGAARSVDGVERLRSLVAHADGRVQIMAGGGVRPQDISALIGAGVDAVHLSAKSYVRDEAGVGGGSESGFEVTDPHIARLAVEAALSAGSRG